MSTNPGRIGKYELQERLSQPGMAEDWKAFDTQASRYVLLKFFTAPPQGDPDFVPRFLREAQGIASLRHPNIVQVYDFQVTQPPASERTMGMLVMDYVEGQTLAETIAHTSHVGKFPSAADAMRLLLPIGMALDYAHQHGVIHRSIRSGNILLGKTTSSNAPIPLLTGFGIAQITNTVSRSLSSVSYLSPEQARGLPGNERSDIYSLGVILYEMFTGALPFQGNSPNDVIAQHINATPTPPVLINPNILPGVTAVIMRCLAKDPAARFASAGEMFDSLPRALNLPVPQQTGAGSGTNLPDDGPTYITPARPPGMTPSSPGISGVPFSSPPQQATATSGGQTPPYISPMTPILPAVSFPGTSTASDFPTTASSQPYPAVQPDAPATSPAAPSSVGTSPAPTLIPPGQSLTPARRSKRRGWRFALLALLLVVVVGSSLGAYFLARNNTNSGTAPPVPILGHASFVSSGLLSVNPDVSQGVTDQLQIGLQNIPPAQAGKSYYAWLVNDKKLEFKPIFLGKLEVKNGAIDFPYQGDAEHTDLLASNSRFLITEEDANITPGGPSLDSSTWRYYAEFSQKPDPQDPKQYSLYDHIRHLLAEDPKLKPLGLTGGLDIWLFRNSEKILEWSGSARDSWQDKGQASFIRRQLTRILDYLDGPTYVQQDLPGQPLLVNNTYAQIPILTFDVQKQDPPGYLYHIGTRHLHEIANNPDASPAQKALANQINTAINTVNQLLRKVRDDAIKLFNMPDNQLLGDDGRVLLDDLATLANNAFVGQIDPFTNQVEEGVVQIHYNIQRLATFDIHACSPSAPCTL